MRMCDCDRFGEIDRGSGKRGRQGEEKRGQRHIWALSKVGRGVSAEENEQRRRKSSGTDFSPD